ncbi:MAG: alpha/beta fold hydrolase [Dehalococcoidia bacterium]
MLKPLDISEGAPWKKRIRAWRVASCSLAPANPDRGIAVTNQSGVQQVYAWEPETGELRQLTFVERGRPGARLAPDGRFIYYLQDDRGNEIGHIVRVPFEGGEPEDITPDLEPYALSMIPTSLDASRIAFIGATRDGFVLRHAAMAADGAIGEWHQAFRSYALTHGPILSSDGRFASMGNTERSGNTDSEIIVVDLNSGEIAARIFEEGGSNTPGRWARRSQRFLAASNASGVNRPYIYDMEAHRRIDLPIDLAGEVAAVDWSDDERSLLVMQTWHARIRLFIYTIETQELRELVHPGGTLQGATFWKDAIVATLNSPERPTTVVELDRQTGEQVRVLLDSEPVEPGDPWKSVSFTSSGNSVIQGWLALPKDHSGEPGPCVIEMHGGPTAVTIEMNYPRYQALLDHGFPVFFLNYRGSVTFGRDFERCIIGDLGNREVDDVVATRKWLVDSGIADPKQVFLTGWSYGGYLTLQTVGRAPGLWAGGIAGIAIADWGLMYEDQAETLRRYQASIFGGTPDQVPDATRTASPITYASDVDTPLLVFQGANDTRCPRRQYEVYEEKMRELGKEITTEWFDAGHGSYVNDVVIEHTEKTLEFLYRRVDELAATQSRR